MRYLSVPKATSILIGSAGVFCVGRWSANSDAAPQSIVASKPRSSNIAQSPSEHIEATQATRALLVATLAAAPSASAGFGETESVADDPVGKAAAAVDRLRRLVPVFRPSLGVEPPSPGARAQAM